MEETFDVELTSGELSLVAFSLGCYLGTLSRDGKLTDAAHDAVQRLMDKINRAREDG